MMATCGKCGYSGPFNHGCGPDSPSVSLLPRIADLEAENARLQGRACLICGRDAPCELDTNKDNDPNWPGSPCTFDLSPIDAARRFMQKRDEWKALAERRKKALEAYPLGFESHHPHMETPYDHECATCRFWRLGRDAINMTPEEALHRGAIDITPEEAKEER